MSRVALVTRRSFLVGAGLVTGGLAVGLFPDAAEADEPSGRAGPGPRAASEAVENLSSGLNPNVMVHIGEDGVVTIVCARSEMGQGVRSAIPVLIADELGATLDRVVVLQAVGDKKYGDQNTDGSSSIRKFDDRLRRMGAVARTMLVAAAAKQWRVKPETCEAADGAVKHPPTKRSLGFGELVKTAAALPVPDEKTVPLRAWAELKNVEAEKLPLLDGQAITTGAGVYGADTKLDGLLYAVVARPPVVGGRVAKLDKAKALAVPGVKKVFEMPTPTKPWRHQVWGGVAVVADTTWAALKGRAALDITWDDGPNAGYDSVQYEEKLLASVRAPGTAHRTVGDVDAAIAKAAKVLEAEYLVPHLPQMPMEPPAVTARFQDGACELWAATQNPQQARSEVAKLLGIGEDKVTVRVTLLGGGFGRKSKADFSAEAAFIAREAGAPVRVQWTRTDDLRNGYHNTVNAQRLRAGLDDKGRVVAWHQRTAFPPIATTFGGAAEPGINDLQQGVLDLALDVPNIRAEGCPAEPHARIGWYRSVYNIFHAFAAGSFIDEIAHARGIDPRDAWLEIIGPARKLSLADLGVAKLTNYGEPLDKHPVDAGRLRGVVERVTALSRWSEQKKAGRALGLAAHRSFVSYVGVVVSVVRDERRKVRVDEAWIVMDAGRVVNKDRVHAQMEGAVVMGISNAMLGGVTYKGGVVQQPNYRDARIARIGDVPRAIHTEIVPSDEVPGGVGEPGVPPVGAACANAIFALTGQRVRRFPLLASVKT